MTPPLKRADWEQLVQDTVERHVAELRQLFATGELSMDEHDAVGAFMQRNMALLFLSDKAWQVLQRLVNESRAVQQTPHEQDPEEAQQA